MPEAIFDSFSGPPKRLSVPYADTPDHVLMQMAQWDKLAQAELARRSSAVNHLAMKLSSREFSPEMRERQAKLKAVETTEEEAD